MRAFERKAAPRQDKAAINRRTPNCENGWYAARVQTVWMIITMASCSCRRKRTACCLRQDRYEPRHP
jgi:hypothetical protein